MHSSFWFDYKLTNFLFKDFNISSIGGKCKYKISINIYVNNVLLCKHMEKVNILDGKRISINKTTNFLINILLIYSKFCRLFSRFVGILF